MADGITLDKVNVEIESNSSVAAKGIDKLTESINRLKSSLNGGLNGLENLNTTIQGISNSLNASTTGIKNVDKTFKTLKNSAKTLGGSFSKMNFGALIKEQVVNGKTQAKVYQKIEDGIKTTTRETKKGISVTKEHIGETQRMAEEVKKVREAAKTKPPEVDLGPVYENMNEAKSEYGKLVKQEIADGKVQANVYKQVKNGIEITTKETKKGIVQTQKYVKENHKLSKALSLVKIAATFRVLKGVYNKLKEYVQSSAEYISNVNYFNTTMGEMGDVATKFVGDMSNKFYLDPSNLMNYMASFNSLIKGFGVGSEEAYKMSKNLTQLSYDLAAFKGISIEDAMQKIKSGISGELEPMRAIGIALDQATLQQTAYTLGIKKKVSTMTRAQKTELLYYQMLKSTNEAQNYFATTLARVGTKLDGSKKLILNPATALSILKEQFSQLARAIGNIFIPVLTAMIPYIMAATQLLTELANSIANFFGFDMKDYDFSKATKNATSGVSAIGNEADKTSKKLKGMLAPFDELNTVSFDNGAGAVAAAGGGSLGIKMPEYDWLENAELKERVEGIKQSMQKLLPIIGVIVALLSMAGIGKIITGLVSGFKGLFTLGGLIKTKDAGSGSVDTIDTVSSGASKLTEKLKTLIKNLALGLVVILEVIVAAGLIVGAIWALGKGLEQVGIAWQPVIDNGTNIAIAMGIGIGILAAIGTAVGFLGQLGGTQLIINMALGTAILAELGIATGLFILEVWAIGLGLEQVGIAWQPVLDNGETIITAIGLGTAMLVAIGTVAGLLGIATTATGGLLPLAIGIGTLMLVELGIATLLFVAEIVIIGEALDKVRKSWSPVLDDGDRVKRAIVTGTALLVAIGTVSAALGVASIATVGLLPLAIALGTAMLNQLEKATIEFIDSLTNVARQLNEKLQPELRKLNEKLPTLTTDLSNYIELMKTFAGYTVDFTKATAVSGFANAINTIIGWFVKDPIEQFADDVEKTYKQALKLNEKLGKATPELETAIDLLSTYFNFLEKLDSITGKNSNISLAGTIAIDMEKVGKNLVTGFVKGIKSEYSGLSNSVKKLFQDTFSNDDASSIGKKFGEKLGEKIKSSIKSKLGTTIKLTSSSGESMGSYSIKAYAGGGFPEVGDLFFANEAGPEWISTMGGKTAVANQDQMTIGIRQAAYEGVSQALRENPQSHKTEVNIGNHKVYSGYGEYQNREANKYGVSRVNV